MKSCHICNGRDIYCPSNQDWESTDGKVNLEALESESGHFLINLEEQETYNDDRVLAFKTRWSKLDPDNGWACYAWPTSTKYLRSALQAASIQPGDVVLDIGAGDARLAIMALQEFGASKAIAIEANVPWALHAKQWLTDKQCMPSNLVFYAAGWQDLDLPKCDICFFAAWHCGDSMKRDILAVLKKTSCRTFVNNFGRREEDGWEVVPLGLRSKTAFQS